MSTDPGDTRITIIGAGAGRLAARVRPSANAATGSRFFDLRQDPRARGFVGGRSINLALSTPRAHRAPAPWISTTPSSPTRSRCADAMMHDRTGRTRYQPYSKNPDEAINSVSRGQLNIKLIEAADRFENVRFRFGTKFVDADTDRAFAVLRDEASGDEVYAEGDLIVGADGAFSRVRSRLQRLDRFDFSQQYLSHGYKELRIPPAADCGVDPSTHDGFALEPNALHIWPRGGSMMIALPNADKSFTCTLFWAFESFDALTTPELARRAHGAALSRRRGAHAHARRGLRPKPRRFARHRPLLPLARPRPRRAHRRRISRDRPVLRAGHQRRVRGRADPARAARRAQRRHRRDPARLLAGPQAERRRDRRPRAAQLHRDARPHRLHPIPAGEEGGETPPPSSCRAGTARSTTS